VQRKAKPASTTEYSIEAEMNKVQRRKTTAVNHTLSSESCRVEALLLTPTMNDASSLTHAMKYQLPRCHSVMPARY